MNCKTCNHPVDSIAKFCPNCGAKIVDGRLSLKGTWEEFIGPFFSWDNNFWRTFFGLFKNPKDVLEAYINGARKKYFHPFSYIILYATVAVFFYKFFPMDPIMDYSTGISESVNTSNGSTKVPKIDMKPFMEAMMNYYNFLVLLLIPIYALTSYIVYHKSGHNFFEHLVFNSYIQTNLGFISLVLQVLLVSILGMTFQSYATLFMIIFVFYTLYILKKLYKQNLKQTIFSGIKYILLFFGLYLGVMTIFSFLFVIIFFLTKM
jgi:hypothetical protein